MQNSYRNWEKFGQLKKIGSVRGLQNTAHNKTALTDLKWDSMTWF